jgi:hypothetical protein
VEWAWGLVFPAFCAGREQSTPQKQNKDNDGDNHNSDKQGTQQQQQQ